MIATQSAHTTIVERNGANYQLCAPCGYDGRVHNYTFKQIAFLPLCVCDLACCSPQKRTPWVHAAEVDVLSSSVNHRIFKEQMNIDSPMVSNLHNDEAFVNVLILTTNHNASACFMDVETITNTSDYSDIGEYFEINQPSGLLGDFKLALLESIGKSA